jgi:hypothetical protein
MLRTKSSSLGKLYGLKHFVSSNGDQAMAEHGDEKGYDDEHRYYQNDEASEEDAIVDDEQSIPDEEVDGEDLDENLEE